MRAGAPYTIRNAGTPTGDRMAVAKARQLSYDTCVAVVSTAGREDKTVAEPLIRRLRLQARAWSRRHPRFHACVRLLKHGPYRGFTDERARDSLLREARTANWRVLYLGSGGRRQSGMVNLDVTWETGPDVVGDGFRLPFADATFDAIFCESVIEHVPDPEAFLSAAGRALKPGGYWYLEVPFLQPFHGGTDFQRWTIAGFHRTLLRVGLAPLASGLHMGPGFMVMWMLREWLALALSGGNAPLRSVWHWLWGFGLSPLLLTDLLLMRLPGAADLACAHYHIARRPLGDAIDPL